MRIAVLATDEQWKELLEGCDDSLLTRVHKLQDDADAFIILNDIFLPEVKHCKKPAIVNAVTETLQDIGAGENIVRINAWKGFIRRKKWEVAGTVSTDIKHILSTINKECVTVADEPGLLAARSVSMIINEAYFALGDDVSTKKEIDIAMKLGTNYPKGPFEWADEIGVQKVYTLLDVLGKKNHSYTPSPALKNEATA